MNDDEVENENSIYNQIHGFISNTLNYTDHPSRPGDLSIDENGNMHVIDSDGESVELGNVDIDLSSTIRVEEPKWSSTIRRLEPYEHKDYMLECIEKALLKGIITTKDIIMVFSKVKEKTDGI